LASFWLSHWWGSTGSFAKASPKVKNPPRRYIIGVNALAYPWISFGGFLTASKDRPGWICVDRLLAEHGIGRDTAEWWREFERRMEARRLDAEEPESLRALRRGWCLGSAGFRQENLEQMEDELGVDHAGALRRESGEAKAERLVGWGGIEAAGLDGGRLGGPAQKRPFKIGHRGTLAKRSHAPAQGHCG